MVEYSTPQQDKKPDAPNWVTALLIIISLIMLWLAMSI
jgi:hypothetical protein